MRAAWRMNNRSWFNSAATSRMALLLVLVLLPTLSRTL